MSVSILAACGDDSPATIIHQDASTFSDSGGDAGAVDTGIDAPFDAGNKLDANEGGDANDAADAPDTSTAGIGYFRIAHVSPGGPAFDICLGSKSGNTFDFTQSAPLAKPQTAAGVAYTQVSRYFGFEAADYAVRFVAAGASSCATALDGKADVPITLSNGGYKTITAAGAWVADAGAPFTTTVFVDDGPFAARVDGGAQSFVRVIREVTRAGTIDVGQNDLANANYIGVFFTVPDHSTTPPNANNADANGYVPFVWQGEAMSAHVDGDATDLAVWNNVTIDVGEVATVFLVPDPNDVLGVRALLCKRDFAQTAQSALNATCTILP